MKLEFSAGAVVYREDPKRGLLFLLLLKDNDEYDIPKGHIEAGESAAVAAKREIKEESGLVVNFVPGFSTGTRYFFYNGKEKVFKRLRIFLAKSETEKVTISEEHKDYGWFDYDETLKKIKFKDLRKVFTDAFDYIGRGKEMGEINKEYAELPASQRKWELSHKLVPGEGPLNAKVMIIGQAPGRFEDERLRPFIGRSGMLLSEALSKARLRRENVYITSVVQFFPPKNRMPTDEEVKLCLPFLKRQIDLIKPKFIITLGSLSSWILVGVESVEQDHGKMVEKDGITYMVTFHPAAALRFKRVHDIMLGDLKKFGAVIKGAKKEKE